MLTSLGLMLFFSSERHGQELYLLACQFDIPGLEQKCKAEAVRHHDMMAPLANVDKTGTARAQILVRCTVSITYTGN